MKKISMGTRLFGRHRAPAPWLAVAAVTMLTLTGCGGGQATPADTAQAVDSAAADATAPARNRVYSVHGSDGVVATALKGSYAVGTADQYDIMVVGTAATATEEPARAAMRAAIESGKEVIIDGDGSTDSIERNKRLSSELAGVSVGTDAVSITKVPGETNGYSVTPIVTAASAKTRAATLGVSESALNTNTVENLYQLTANSGVQKQ